MLTKWTLMIRSRSHVMQNHLCSDIKKYGLPGDLCQYPHIRTIMASLQRVVDVKNMAATKFRSYKHFKFVTPEDMCSWVRRTPEKFINNVWHHCSSQNVFMMENSGYKSLIKHPVTLVYYPSSDAIQGSFDGSLQGDQVVGAAILRHKSKIVAYDYGMKKGVTNTVVEAELYGLYLLMRMYTDLLGSRAEGKLEIISDNMSIVSFLLGVNSRIVSQFERPPSPSFSESYCSYLVNKILDLIQFYEVDFEPMWRYRECNGAADALARLVRNPEGINSIGRHQTVDECIMTRLGSYVNDDSLKIPYFRIVQDPLKFKSIQFC